MTHNEIAALMSWMAPWQLPLPVDELTPDGLTQADLQQLLWGFPGILWGDFVPPVLPASEVWRQTFRVKRLHQQTFQR